MSRFSITDSEPGKQLLIGFVALPVLFLVSWWCAFVGAHAAIALVEFLGQALQNIPVFLLKCAGALIAGVCILIHLPATIIVCLTIVIAYPILRFVPGWSIPIFLALAGAWLLGNFVILFTRSMRGTGPLFWLLSYWKQQVFIGAYALAYGCPLLAGSYMMYIILSWLRGIVS